MPKACLLIALAALALLPLRSVAQESDGLTSSFDPYPLRPADTSSPRDTLRSFLANANAAIYDWRQDKVSQETHWSRRRAIETLDLSVTAYHTSWAEQTGRILLLKEILDRIEVPPLEEVPGDDEVAAQEITRWAIPNTRIAIERVAEGPRAGEFLFSAGTVANLDRYYRRVSHLPYRPGATVGVYEDFIASEFVQNPVSAQVSNLLRPISYASPLSTFQGFLESANRAHALVMEAETALRAEPPGMSVEQARELEAEAGSLLDRAIATLDLSEVPRALRQDVGLEAVLRLKEVIDRVALPAVDTVPDAQMLATARQGSASWAATADGTLRWRIPNTEIDIAEIAEGPRRGQFLFSAETVDRAGQFYGEVMNLPYRPADRSRRYIDYRSPQTSEGFYEFYVSSPGYLVPSAYFLGQWLGDLPDWATALHNGQTVWQWLGLLISVLLAAVAAYIVFRSAKRMAKRLRPPLKHWTKALIPVLIAIIIIAIQDFVDNGLNITGDVLAAVTTISEAVVLVMAAWAVFELCKAIAETVIASPKMGDQSIDASLMRIGMRILGFLAGAWIIIVGIGKLGADVVPILAGLGVGGLAVALAAQTTLANFIGGILLYANRPVRIGDWCEFGDKKGTVESIGLQSTRVRALDRTLITVPNAEMANMQIINWASCDQMLILTTIGLRYETKPEQLRYVLAKLREMFLAHPKIDNETVRVRFVGYGASSLDIQIRVYALAREFNEFYAIQEDVLLRVAEIVEESGSSFAFPSQTLYLGRDEGLDDDRGAAAMRQVHSWRRAGRLPFPNMAREEQDRLAATLDYPPRGSPDAGRPEGLEDQAAEPLSAEPLSAEPLSAEPEEEVPEESKEKEPAEPERR